MSPIGRAKPATIVIFGASGDLTQRKLVPALHTLSCRQLLSPQTHVIGIARSDYTDEEFRDRLYDGIVEYSRAASGPRDVCELWSEYAKNYSYMPGDLSDMETYRRLGERLASLNEGEETDASARPGSNVLFYMAVPPVIYTMIVERLGRSSLNQEEEGWRRVIVEKPFGHDLDSARQLNDKLHAVFEERQVYRIDHYLGKETVQNIMSFRFANAIFEPLWTRKYIDHVQISVAESTGVGHRAAYYEDAGVLRDMFQNHLLQLLTLTAMEPPPAFNDRFLRDEKVKVLQAVRPIQEETLVLGQYEGYRATEGVAADSTTPTYAALRLYVDNWRWQGVPFYLRSGKAMPTKQTEIMLQFKRVPHLLFPENVDLTRNRLSLCIQPDESIHLRFETKQPGAGMHTAPVEMSFNYDQDFGARALPEAYERLLLDAIQGDASLFTRADEIELAWALFDPLLDQGEPERYAKDSWGPQGAEALIATQNCGWQVGCLRDEEEKEKDA
jgi:glucose-6-phosphate 1-dehydrogenase